LTKYQIIIGDNKIINQQYFSFITGPYTYCSNDIVKPRHWYTYNRYRVNSYDVLEVYYDDVGWQTNFVTIAQFALSLYDDYIKNRNNESRRLFFKQVEYICSNYDIINGMIAYPYKFSFRNLPPYWYSGLAQGQILSVLTRAFVLTNNYSYLFIANKVADFMFVPVEQGGVFTLTPEGYAWIEEYPTIPHSYVLNGFVFAVIGLIDYNKISPSRKISNALNDFIFTIKNTVDIYDTGSKLLYERFQENYCSILYLGAQTYQCLHMYHATKDTFFYNLYEKWYKYFDINDFIAIYN
jgi:hypothetical protein